jgi:hypothetical protein
LCGTDAASVAALVGWRAELQAASIECSNAAADGEAAEAQVKAAKAQLKAAQSVSSNAAARSAIASERRQFAWDRYLVLLAEATPDSTPASPIEASSTVSAGARVEDFDASMAAPEPEDGVDGSDDGVEESEEDVDELAEDEAGNGGPSEEECAGMV